MCAQMIISQETSRGKGPPLSRTHYLCWLPSLRSCAKGGSLSPCRVPVVKLGCLIVSLGISTPSPDSSARLRWAQAARGPEPGACYRRLPASVEKVQLRKKERKSLPSFSFPAQLSSFPPNLSRLDCLRSLRHLHNMNLNSPCQGLPEPGGAAAPVGDGWDACGPHPAMPGSPDRGAAGRVQQSPGSLTLVQGSAGAKALSMYQ